METTLHRQLKTIYAGERGETELMVGTYRIDAVVGSELVEIQLGSLAALRKKLTDLLPERRVRVVKPWVARKRILRSERRDSIVVSTRKSPRQGSPWEIFWDLVYLRGIFPHPNLTIEAPEIDVDERRPIAEPVRRRRRRGKPKLLDVELTRIEPSLRIRTVKDLVGLLPADLPQPFHTGDLATALELPRWWAQKIAYVYRHADVVEAVGMQKRSHLYAFTAAAKPNRATAKRTRQPMQRATKKVA